MIRTFAQATVIVLAVLFLCAAVTEAEETAYQAARAEEAAQ